MSFYYAYLDEKDICISVSDLGVEVTDDYYIRIDTLDQSLIGKWYDRTDSTFKDAPVHILADHSSSIVNYKNQDVWLDDVIDGKANISDVYTKTTADSIFVKETDLLDKIKTVDGAGSGLDADTLDGKHASEFATSGHTHSAYAAVSHTHNEYAPVSHTHDYAASNHTHSQYANSGHTHAISDVENLQSSLDGKANTSHTHNYAAVNHTHDYAASEHTHAISEVTGLQSALDGKSSSSHTHSAATTSSAGLMSAEDKTKLDGIATGANKTTVDSALSSTSTNPVQNKVINSALAGKAASNHTHSGYASIDHTHSEYAASSHTHDDYFSVDGGTINGDTNVDGVLRVRGNQAYNFSASSNTQTIGTNNATGGTTIGNGSSASVNVNGANIVIPNCLPRTNNAYYCGNATYRWKGIYSTAAVNVSSDERLKRDISPLDCESLAKFINALKVVSYNYKTDEVNEKARIGLIAQDVQKADTEISKFFVSEDESGMLGIAPADLVFPLIAAVQELQKELKNWKRE